MSSHQPLQFNIRKTHKTSLRGFKGQPTAMRPLCPLMIHVEAAQDLPSDSSGSSAKQLHACIVADAVEAEERRDADEDGPRLCAAPEVREHDAREDLHAFMSQIEGFLLEQQHEEAVEEKRLYGDPADPRDVGDDPALRRLRISVEVERFMQEFDNIDQTAVEGRAARGRRWAQAARAATEDEQQLDVFEDDIEKVDTEPQQQQPLSTLRRSLRRSQSTRGSRRSKKTNPDTTPVKSRVDTAAANLVPVTGPGDTPERPYETFFVFTFVECESLNGFGPFMDLYKQIINGVQKHKAFEECVLLKCVEKNVPLPYIYFARFTTNEAVDEDNQYFWLDVSNDVQLKQKYNRQQGSFQEINNYVVAPSDARLLPDSPASLVSPYYRRFGYRGYIVIACKILEDSDTRDFEAMWQGWTGAGYISKKMPRQFGLNKINLYKRRSADRTFMYVCIVECANILDPGLSVRVLQFVEAFRLRISCYTALYKAENIRRASDPESYSSHSGSAVSDERATSSVG